MKNIIWPNSRKGILKNIFILIFLNLIFTQWNYEQILAVIFIALFLTIGQRLTLLGIKGQGSFLDSFINTTYFLFIAFMVITFIIFVGDTFFIEEKTSFNVPRSKN